MEPVTFKLTFKPNPGRLTAQRVIGLALAVGGGGLGCCFLLVGVLLLPVLLNAESTSGGSALWGLVFPVAGLLFLVFFVGMGAALALSHTGELVQLTAGSIVHAQGKSSTALPLTEITNLQVRYAPGYRTPGHWVLVISGQSGQLIELDIPQPGYLAAFDVLPILRELLPRLPCTVRIDPRVQGYAATGQMRFG